MSEYHPESRGSKPRLLPLCRFVLLYHYSGIYKAHRRIPQLGPKNGISLTVYKIVKTTIIDTQTLAIFTFCHVFSICSSHFKVIYGVQYAGVLATSRQVMTFSRIENVTAGAIVTDDGL